MLADFLAFSCSGPSGSGKSYNQALVISQLLRIAQTQAQTSVSSSAAAAAKRVPKLCEQIRATQTLISAFTCAKTASNCHATRTGKVTELHYINPSDDSTASILSGAKILTFGLDKSRLYAPLGKDERSFHVFYQFLSGASAKDKVEYRLLADLSEYDLLASSGCYKLSPSNDAGQQATSDEIAYADLRAALDILGFKAKHVEMIFKLLSAILLLGNVRFNSSDLIADADQESTSVSHESVQVFHDACGLLGLAPDDLERALVNKTTYVKKEVICTLLTEEGAIKQRDSLMSSLYAILCSYVIESANHRIYPGDDQIKKTQRDSATAATSIVMLDLPGFQTKSPNGGLADQYSANSGSGVRRSTLIDAYGKDGYEQFMVNSSAELLQHWLNRRTFNDDSHDLVKRMMSDGIKLPEVDALDSSATTLELLRGGEIGSRADSKAGGMLGGLTKTCSNLRKGKLASLNEADEAFSDGIEERFRTHSRFINRAGSGATSAFGVKHYLGTVSYSTKDFVERDSDMFDSEFVRLFRQASTETFLAKLFSGPSLAAESHPRDQTVIVAAQVSQQPLRLLSPLKVSRSASTAVSSDMPEPDLEPVSSQMNEALTDILASLNEIPIWSLMCIKPNDANNTSAFDVNRVRMQIEGIELRNMLSRRRISYMDSMEFTQLPQRYKAIGGEDAGSGEGAQAFLEGRSLAKGKDFEIGKTSLWLSFTAWKSLEGSLRALELKRLREVENKRRAANVAIARKSLEAKGARDSSDTSPTSEKRVFGAFMEPAVSRDTLIAGSEADGIKAAYESTDDLVKNASPHAGAGQFMPNLPYDTGLGRPQPGYLRQSQMSFSPSALGNQLAAGDVWGPEWKNSGKGFEDSPASPNFPTIAGQDPNRGGKEGNQGEKGGKKATTMEEVPTSTARRLWLVLVWTFTWWIPSFMLTYVGRMKRPDVRIAWREKVTLCMLIFLFCGGLVRLGNYRRRISLHTNASCS